MTNRTTIRRSITKNAPSTSDLLDGELGYSFVSNQFFIKNPLTGLVDTIGGKYFVDSLSLVNKTPIASAATTLANDTQNTITGNFLTLMNASDLDGDPLSIYSVSYGSQSIAMGNRLNTAFGSMGVNTNGQWEFWLSQAARALRPGNVVNEVFSVTITDGKGALITRPFTLEITGTQQAPVVTPSSGFAPFGQAYNANILQSVVDYEGDPLTITEWTILGIPGINSPGTTVSIPLSLIHI